MSNARTSGPAPEAFGPEAFQEATGVSRETLNRLLFYAERLRHWQARVNLVGPRTLDALWWRHFLDSAQLYPLIPAGARTLVDLGSGAGFPGLVLAIMGVPEVHLIESDQRKAVFLREVSRETAPTVTVHAVRIESAPAIVADCLTARALAPLDRLLSLADRFRGPSTVYLFPKGQDLDRELTQTTRLRYTHMERVPSVTAPDASILRITEARRADCDDDHR